MVTQVSIYNRFREAFAEEWAFVAFSAVAFVSFWFIEFHKDGLVVAVNDLLDVGHTGVADFDCIPVEHGQKCETVTLLFIYSKALFE